MADQMIHEMIAAFAAGCMDKDNYAQFKNYLNEGGELPEGELGELQNIISMIPVILDLEKPDAAIKDMVAKKLIGMKEEIKTKIIEGKKKTVSTKIKTNLYNKSETTPALPPKQNTLSFVAKNALTSSSTFKFGHDEPSATFASETTAVPSIKEKTKTDSSKIKALTEDPMRLESIPPPSALFTPPPAKSEKPSQPEKTSSGAAGWIALLLTIILFTILSYFTYSSINSMQRELEDLQANVTALKSELGRVNNFIANYNSLIEFFNYKDIDVVSLTNSDAAEKASARLLLSFNEKEGLIQFKNAKQIPSNQAFQVWYESRGNTYSMGTYQPNDGEYLKVTSFPFIPKEQIELFRVTIESKEGSVSASALNYLTGTLSGVALRGRRN